MSNSYKFLAHEAFQKKIKDFLTSHPKNKKSLFTNLERARSNPFSGKPMHSLPRKFRQKVYRLWIGGATDFRFIYYVDKKNLIVLGIYLTLEHRAKFSYDKGDWLETLENIVSDLEGQCFDKFAVMNTEAALKQL